METEHARMLNNNGTRGYYFPMRQANAGMNENDGSSGDI